MKICCFRSKFGSASVLLSWLVVAERGQMIIAGEIEKDMIHENSGYFSYIDHVDAGGGIFVDFTCKLKKNGEICIVWLHKLPQPHGYRLSTTHIRYLTCKGGEFNWPLFELNSDWKMLKEAVEKYCKTEEFEEHYIRREDYLSHAPISANEAGQTRFWLAVAKMCDDLRINQCLPIATWHSAPLKLYGGVHHVSFCSTNACSMFLGITESGKKQRFFCKRQKINDRK
ncbi:unnamed protein product [Gongylonema pulchrum]|uniref:Uncharacterized protein n=1 Tax=Gongylonema pulchrum TaxID=637853 RepID=A0A3P7N4X6_9BILA|nr:unnamed protein product [Gongylonema pulchrum]